MVKNDSQSTISLGNAPEVLDLVANSIMGLWDVVNNLTGLRPSQRERYRVTFLGLLGLLKIIGSMPRCATWPRSLPGWDATSSPAVDRD
jgi:hypothetical protein